jgi:DNA mismatch repair protein MutS
MKEKAFDTPMFEQYFRIKAEHKDAILFFHLGDFYEMFGDDALEVSSLLNLTLTSRNKLPMCGVPCHSSRSYIARLLRAGKKVAVCEQITEPGKGLIERKVVEVVTPGTTIDEYFLDKSSSNYLGCLCIDEKSGKKISFAYIDVSAGDFYATSFPYAEAVPKLRQEFERLQMREIIVQESFLNEFQAVFEDKKSRMVLNKWGDWLFNREKSLNRLKKQFAQRLKGFGVAEDSSEILSAGALLEYLDDTAGALIPHVKRIRLYRDTEFVCIDEATQRNLELTKNLQDGTVRFSLLEALDETKTAMGRRLLKRRLLQPLLDIDQINARLDMVERFYQNQPLLEQVRDILSKTPDLERLLSRLAMDKAHGKDMAAIKNALNSIESLNKKCGDFTFEDADAANFNEETLVSLQKLRNLLECGLCDDPSILLTEGNLIRDDFDSELDNLRALRDNGRQTLESYVEEERNATGIATLKIRSNRVIGYYFEVTNTHLSKVPKYFIKRQGIANGERYTTDRLAGLESDINGAFDKIVELEKRLFLELRETAKSFLNEIMSASRRVAELDAAQSLAEAALLKQWVRPELQNGSDLAITEARHPVVEAYLPSGEFIPNDIKLEGNGVSFALITGPNMAGKSTYLRQAALIVIMAQMGGFVPAKTAKIGLADRIYCRVGASDNLARGESTFLVEMHETAYILNTASEKSLVIMDEVGRGTGTKDGLAIAWAVSEELLDTIKCRALFATHYHELSSITHPRLANRSMEVLEDNGELVFLRKLKEGAASESYGLHAARLAGLSEQVLERADRIMEKLQANERAMSDIPPPENAPSPTPFSFHKTQKAVLKEITRLPLDSLSPREALNQLYIWKQLLEKGENSEKTEDAENSREKNDDPNSRKRKQKNAENPDEFFLFESAVANKDHY